MIKLKNERLIGYQESMRDFKDDKIKCGSFCVSLRMLHRRLHVGNSQN